MTELERYIKFTEAAMLDKTHDPWVRRRKSGVSYAMVMIASSERPDWWYAPYIGIECMVELVFNYGTNELREANVVRLTNTKVHHGRNLSAKDFIII